MKITLKKAIVEGKIAEGYFVCQNGDIWSNKRGSYNKMNTHIGGTTKYPKVNIRINGETKVLYPHRIVCETFHSFPKPESVTKEEWKNTPEAVKKIVGLAYQVNHIDHNKENHHPSNLEWVTVRQNQIKSQKHYGTSKA